jgi:hypothetical protein
VTSRTVGPARHGGKLDGPRATTRARRDEEKNAPNKKGGQDPPPSFKIFCLPFRLPGARAERELHPGLQNYFFFDFLAFFAFFAFFAFLAIASSSELMD